MSRRATKGQKPGPGVIIRQARTKDVPAILRLWKEMMAFHAAREPFFALSRQAPANFRKWIKESIAKDGRHLAVAVLGTEVVGYSLSVVTRYPPVFTREWYCDIYDFAVTERLRREGIGRALFADIRQWAAAEGIQRIEARVAIANEVSTRFWRSVGLRPYMESLFIDL